jgi:hypothetical protein
MSIDTTFHPLTETVIVDNTAGGQQIKSAGQRGVTTFRIAASGAAAGNVNVSWGVVAPASPTAPAAVGVLDSGVFTVGVVIGAVCYLEVPPNSIFITNAAFATSFAEITGGIGGVGG